MTYTTALRLQTLASWGMLAYWRLIWDMNEQAKITSEERAACEDRLAEGLAAVDLLWEAGIRFSFIRALTEEECVGTPGWNPSRHPSLEPLQEKDVPI